MSEKIQVNKYMKNFFFFTFKSRSEFKELRKEMGNIDTVSIIIANGKAILRAKSGEKKVDTPFTDEEMKKFLRHLKVKPQTIEESKSIFVMMDMEKKNIHIQQNKLNGEKKEYTI
jgi:hypothetical protein